MLNLIRSVVSIVVLSLALPVFAQTDFRERIDGIAPTVVRVSVYVEGSQEPIIGTGFAIWKTGEIFTNEHVIDQNNIDRIIIETFVDFFDPPRPMYEAEVAFVSPNPDRFDFAILQVVRDLEGQPVNLSELNMPYIRRWNDDPNLGLTSQLIVLAYPRIGQDNLVIAQGTLTAILNQNDSSEMTADVAFGDGASGGMVVDGDFKLLGIATTQRSEGIGQSVVGFLSMQAICGDGVIDCRESNPKRRETLEHPTCQITEALEYCDESIFGIGDMAQVGGLDTLNPLREDPFSTAGILVNVPRGEFVEIVDGPALSYEDPAFRTSEFFWWKVRRTNGTEGWLTENYFGEPTMVFARLEDPLIPTASCVLTAMYPLTIRGGPSTSFPQVASRRYNSEIAADGQIQGRDGRIWWRLIEGFWVREDTVREAGPCFSLPVVEEPDPQ